MNRIKIKDYLLDLPKTNYIVSLTTTETSEPFYSLSELRLPRPPKTVHANTPPHVYIMMWKYLHNADQMFNEETRHGFSNRSSVEAPCQGETVFLCKSTLFGLPKVDAFRNHEDYLQQNCSAFYGRPFREPRRGGHSDFAMTICRFWISDCMFCY